MELIGTYFRWCVIILLGQPEHCASDGIDHIQLESVKLLLDRGNFLKAVSMNSVDVIAIEKWVSRMNPGKVRLDDRSPYVIHWRPGSVPLQFGHAHGPLRLLDSIGQDFTPYGRLHHLRKAGGEGDTRTGSHVRGFCAQTEEADDLCNILLL